MLSVRISSRKARFCIAVCVVWFLAATANAQTIEHVQEFWAFTDVQFLPGGYVVKDDGGQIERYVYKDSKFVRFKEEIPSLVKGWIAFAGNADYLDQFDVRVQLPLGLTAILPKRAKVKKYFEIGPDVALVCYTRKLNIEGSNTNDVFLIAAPDTKPGDSRAEYRRLWTRKLKAETNYGDLQYQSVSGVGDFLLLYTEDVAGDAVGHQLDVYRLRGIEGGKAPSKSRSISPQRLSHSAPKS
ncbi:MAG TPA: hypothetical protein VJA94_00740 [Candidatus Angelobacter sp.]